MSSGSVYIGVWTNYRTGTITLTVTQDVGSILTAALALFVSVAMGHLWSIVCFIIHQIRSTPRPHSGLHHQRQALLRNTTTAASTAWMLTRLAWTWRGKSRGVAAGTAVLVPISVLFVVFIAGMSILSSRIQLINSDVLLTGQECGRVSTLRVTDGRWGPAAGQAVVVMRKWSYDRATEYGQACYGPTTLAEGPEPAACRDFPLTRVPMSIRVGVPCPFGDGICAEPNGAMTLDTGLIDSNDHLGVNSPPGDRIKYQRTLTCAPIKGENYSSPWMAKPPSDAELGEAAPAAGVFYKTYNLGPSGNTNYTMLSSNKTTDTLYHLFALSSPAFSRGDATAGGWTPIPQLDVKDADVTLVVLRNEVLYQDPVRDPWFRASAVGYRGGGLNPDGYYTADQMAASFIACAERHRICSSNTSCTAFGGVSANGSAPAVTAGVDMLGSYDAGRTGVRFNRQQMAVHDLLQQDRFGSLVAFIRRGTRVLRALDFVTYEMGQLGLDGRRVLSSSPPGDQWQVEVAGMFNASVANMQVLAAQLAAPPVDLPVPVADASSIRNTSSSNNSSSSINRNSSSSGRTYSPSSSSSSFRLAEFMQRPVEDQENASVCARVRRRNLQQHANFTFVPLVAVLAAGLVVMLFNLCCIPGVVFWLQKKVFDRKGRRCYHRRREWQEGHLFMLQKAKLEAEGMGPWEVDEGGDIPWIPAASSRERLPLVEGAETKSIGIMAGDSKRSTGEWYESSK